MPKEIIKKDIRQGSGLQEAIVSSGLQENSCHDWPTSCQKRDNTVTVRCHLKEYSQLPKHSQYSGFAKDILIFIHGETCS